MKASRTLAPTGDVVEQRPNDLLAPEAREATVAQIAAASDCAPSTLYLRTLEVLHALEPRPAGTEARVRDGRDAGFSAVRPPGRVISV